MSSVVFLEFLSRIKQEEKSISLLSNEIQEVEKMSKSYVSVYFTQGNLDSIIAHFRKKTNAFYSKTKEIKENIEHIREDYSIKGVLEHKMYLHISSLYQNLENKKKEFLEKKSSFLNAVEKKQEFLSSFGTEKQERKKMADEDTIKNKGTIADEKIQNTLLNIEDINTTSIELNEIISNSSIDIERVASKMLFSQNMSTEVNSQMEITTVRRKGLRWLKVCGVILFIGLCGVLFIYFGKQILDFIIKIKDALK